MILHGYRISDSALLEASNIYKLRALVQNQLANCWPPIQRGPFLETLGQELRGSGFESLTVKFIDLQTGLDADDFDDELLLLIDTEIPHVLAIQ